MVKGVRKRVLILSNNHNKSKKMFLLQHKEILLLPQMHQQLKQDNLDKLNLRMLKALENSLSSISKSFGSKNGFKRWRARKMMSK